MMLIINVRKFKCQTHPETSNMAEDIIEMGMKENWSHYLPSSGLSIIQ